MGSEVIRCCCSHTSTRGSRGRKYLDISDAHACAFMHWHYSFSQQPAPGWIEAVAMSVVVTKEQVQAIAVLFYYLASAGVSVLWLLVLLG